MIFCYYILAMKTAIHPKYEKTTIKCACGNEFETRSTVAPEIHTELCSACHPFYTGKQKFVDTAGRVDKFRARQEAANATKGSKVKSEKSEDKTEKTNQEKLAEIKNEITAKPEVVAQEMTSDVEIAAASELEDNAKTEK